MASSNHVDVTPHNQDAISIRSEEEDGEVDGDFVGPSQVTPFIYILLKPDNRAHLLATMAARVLQVIVVPFAVMLKTTTGRTVGDTTLWVVDDIFSRTTTQNWTGKT